MTGPYTTDHFGEVLANLRQLESDNVVERLQARKRLVALSERAVPQLVEALRYADRRPRWEAAKVLAEIADPVSAPALVGMLEDEDPGIRWVAIGGLKALKSAALVPVLQGLITRSDSSELRTGAGHVLRSLRERELRSLVMPVLSAIRGPVPDVAAPVAACNALNAWRRQSAERKAKEAAAIKTRGATVAVSSNVRWHSRRRSRELIPPSILLAEDDQELRSMLAWILRKDGGFRVTECTHGVELLDHLGSSVLGEEPEQEFDLIISDIRMPGVSGLTVLEGISGREGFPPVILITAFGDEETHRRARQFGAVAVLDKPFNTDHLVSKAHEVISRSRRII